MKSIFLLSSPAVVGIVFSSCAGPDLSDEAQVLKIKMVAPEATPAMAQRAGASLEQIGMGYWIFQRKCLECHQARVPKEPTDANWHPIMDGMTWSAGLARDESEALFAYLRAAGR
ncbi:MAG: hypothetical protein OSB65_05025 [Roseibacillus sp.]|nr:hypothetical protein [Roseibacillus sp.]